VPRDAKALLTGAGAGIGIGFMAIAHSTACAACTICWVDTCAMHDQVVL